MLHKWHGWHELTRGQRRCYFILSIWLTRVVCRYTRFVLKLQFVLKLILMIQSLLRELPLQVVWTIKDELRRRWHPSNVRIEIHDLDW